MMVRFSLVITFILSAMQMSGMVLAQESAPLPNIPECDAQQLAQQQTTLMELLVIDFEADPLAARDNLFRLGAIYQLLALQCGYVPSKVEINAMIENVLAYADIAEIIAANSTGTDVDVVLTELGTVRGDLFNGQLLYNGLANGIDGAVLGCSGCHSSVSAPPTEGTWTRITEVRLSDPTLANYDVQRYLVESILQPDAYIVPDFGSGLMPPNYGARLDLQMLADLVAYLDSQDQLLDE